MILTDTSIQRRPDNPFDVFHVGLRGDQVEIGGALAALAGRHATDAGAVETVTVEQAAALDALFAHHCPSLHRRAAGFKQASGRPADAHPYSLPVIAERPSFGCSVALYDGPSGPMVVRNYDFTLRSQPELMGAPGAGVRPIMDPVYLMRIVPDDGGRSTIGLVSMDLFAGTFDGINESGLCVCLLALSNDTVPADTPRFDAFDELSIVRVLLETCDSVQEAVALFGRLPKQTVFIPCHYLIADRHGDGAILEWDARGSHIVRRADHAPLVCTNHRLADAPSCEDRLGPDERQWSETRYRRLTEKLAGARRSEEAAWSAAASVRFGAFDATVDIFGGTLWTSLYDLGGGSAAFRFLNRIADGSGHYSEPHQASFA